MEFKEFEVIVGGLGAIYKGNNHRRALRIFTRTVKNRCGIVSNRCVTLVHNGKIERQEFQAK